MTLRPLAPKASVSANSTNPALSDFHCIATRFFFGLRRVQLVQQSDCCLFYFSVRMHIPL